MTEVPALLVGDKNSGRRKRSTDEYHDHNIKRRSLPDTQPVVRSNFTWPTPSGITEDQATALCENTIRTSPAFAKCYELFEDNIFEATYSCVDDIKVSLSSLLFFCILNIHSNLQHILRPLSSTLSLS